MAKAKTQSQPAKQRGKSTSVDSHVGQKLRQFRSLAGLSQERLAGALGVTFQQVQKYERGLNRIASNRLFQLGQILNVPVTAFFEGYVLSDDDGGLSQATGLAEAETPAYEVDVMQRKETLDLVRAYYRIQDPIIRKKLLELARSMAGEPVTDATDSTT